MADSRDSRHDRRTSEVAKTEPGFWSVLGPDEADLASSSDAYSKKRKSVSQEDILSILGITGDESLHRRSTFLDVLTSTPSEKNAAMDNYHLFAEIRSPPSPTGAESDSESKPKRNVLHSIHVAEPARTASQGKEFLDDLRSDSEGWTTESAHEPILQTIKTNTVPKAKKNKKKKKRKKGTPIQTEDVMTQKEATLNYQIVTAEERLKDQLIVYRNAKAESEALQVELKEARKRYDQEMQAIKAEYTLDDDKLRTLQDQWSATIVDTEAAITKTEQDTKDTVHRLRDLITAARKDISDLKRETRIWEAFRAGQMRQNLAEIEQLTGKLKAQKEDERNYQGLTDNLIHLSEEHAKEAEKKALEDLCDRHLLTVRDNLPPEELQGIEDYDILFAELSSLNLIFENLTRQTDLLQKKILHQTAGAQLLLAAVNTDNADLTRTKLFKKWSKNWKNIDAPHFASHSRLAPENMFDNFRDLDNVRGKINGLHVVGTRAVRPHKPAKVASALSATSHLELLSVTSEASSHGLLLQVPRLDKRSHSTISIPSVEETDILKTVEQVRSAEVTITADDPLQNYGKPVMEAEEP